MLAALAERDGAVVDFPGLVRDDRDAILAALGLKARPREAAGGRTSSSCRADRASASKISRRCSSPHMASSPCTASPCVRAVRPAWARSDRGWSSCCPAIPSRRSAPTTSSPAARFARSADARRTGRTDRCARRSRARSARRSGASTTRAFVVEWQGSVEPLSVSGASVLSSTTRADGFVIVEQDSEGYAAGSEVEVWLYA